MILRSGARLVMLAPSVLERMEHFSHPPENATEAGGILIGRYRDPHIEVIECSVPMPEDGRARFLFDRRDPGHQSFAMERWRDSGRTETFVGEWHTHPERLPTPSSTDVRTWHEVARKNPAGASLFVIRGHEGWWAGLIAGTSMLQLTVVPRHD
jgi:integrative and conjugative element protein (TIGR02256 family)